jgi:hypothetical protein
MICLISFNLLVMLYLSEMPLLGSSYAYIFSLMLSFQSLNHLLSVKLSTDYFGPKWSRSLKQLILPYILTFIEIGIELCSILNIRSQNSYIGISLPNLFFTIQIILLRILISIMIIFDRRRKDNSLFLSNIKNTFFEY